VNLKVKVEFVNDLPMGTWRFMYEDGSHWQTIEFLKDDFQVLSYHDVSGVQKVKLGEGRYEGAIFSAAVNDILYPDGQLEDGVKDGYWVYYDQKGNIIYEEKYVKGDFRNTRM
jgi:antitoxin component YwqK of YwqJK toxin-antitoxin module